MAEPATTTTCDSDLVWQQIIAEYEASGLNIKEFSIERGIKYHSLKWQLKKRETCSSNKFVELSVPEVQAEYGIRFGNGRELVLKGSYSVARVKQLVDLLEGRND